MNAPRMLPARPVTPDISILTAHVPLPGFGLLHVNAFVLRAAEPVLIDTGVVALAPELMDSLRSCIEVSELRWIWLTHADPDHLGSVQQVLEEAPQAKLVTTYLGAGKLSLSGPVPLERIYLLNPGQQLDVGDRQLLAVRPPIYDAPETTAVFDRSTGVLFSADSFGALLPEPAEEARALEAGTLRRAC